jgi:hypothetical protein
MATDPASHRSADPKVNRATASGRSRAAFVEAAWRLVRFQPEYRAVVKWHHFLGQGALASGPARKKAIVAVARQLAVDLWRIRTGRVKAETLGLI